MPFLNKDESNIDSLAFKILIGTGAHHLEFYFVNIKNKYIDVFMLFISLISDLYTILVLRHIYLPSIVCFQY